MAKCLAVTDANSQPRFPNVRQSYIHIHILLRVQEATDALFFKSRPSWGRARACVCVCVLNTEEQQIIQLWNCRHARQQQQATSCGCFDQEAGREEGLSISAKLICQEFLPSPPAPCLSQVPKVKFFLPPHSLPLFFFSFLNPHKAGGSCPPGRYEKEPMK